jgi:transaldolase
MGASFRSVDQILALAGCDLLTISPDLLQQLEQDFRTVEHALSDDHPALHHQNVHDVLNKASFKALLEHDLMASQLLQSGIDGFIKAREQLNILLRQTFGLDEKITA